MSVPHIEQIPCDELWNILKYTDDETLNKCLFVSKKFNYTVNKYRHYLKKARMDRCTIEVSPEQLFIDVNTSSKEWRCALRPTPEQPCTVNDVVNFYITRGEIRNEENFTPPMRMPVTTIEEGLQVHLPYLFSRAFFRIFELIDTSATAAGVVRRAIRKCKPQVPNSPPFAETIRMTYRGILLEEDHLKLFKEIGAEKIFLMVNGDMDMNLLFKAISEIDFLQHIRIFVFSQMNTEVHVGLPIEQMGKRLVVDDDYLLRSRAKTIRCHFKFRLSGIRTFIQQVSEGRRQLDFFQTYVAFPEENTESLEHAFDVIRQCPGVEQKKEFYWIVYTTNPSRRALHVHYSWMRQHRLRKRCDLKGIGFSGQTHKAKTEFMKTVLDKMENIPQVWPESNWTWNVDRRRSPSEPRRPLLSISFDPTRQYISISNVSYLNNH